MFLFCFKHVTIPYILFGLLAHFRIVSPSSTNFDFGGHLYDSKKLCLSKIVATTFCSNNVDFKVFKAYIIDDYFIDGLYFILVHYHKTQYIR